MKRVVTPEITYRFFVNGKRVEEKAPLPQPPFIQLGEITQLEIWGRISK